MMRALRLNVIDDRRDARLADGERALPVLPREVVQGRESFVYPF